MPAVCPCAAASLSRLTGERTPGLADKQKHPICAPGQVPHGAPPFLTLRVVAKRLGVSAATVYALCRRGELAHYRVSNAIRVSEEALKYLDTRRNTNLGATNRAAP